MASSAPTPAHEPTPASLPVALHVAGRRCVVVGGGHVGIRRAVQLRRCGAEVEVISPQIWPEHAKATLDDESIVWSAREFRAGDLDGAFVVVAATGRSDVDAAVLAEAATHGALVNNVRDAGDGDMSFVATRDIGHVQVSVSTDGRTPALTRYIRDRLAEEVADGYPELVVLFAEARDALKADGRPTTHPGWDAALDAGILDQVRSGDTDGARAELRRHLGLSG